MKVALIHVPYRAHTVFSENLKVVDDEFILGPPIILAYVAAILEKAGHRVLLIDAHGRALSKRETLKELADFNPDVMGVRLETYHFHETLEWVRFLKAQLRVPVIGGGINMTFYPEESMSHKEIDYGIAGEATGSLPRLVDALENRRSVSGIDGLVYRDGDRIKINPPSPDVMPFDDYPFPARHLLQNDIYHSFVSQRKNYTVFLTSVGCPFRCTFCVIAKLKYRFRTAENVMEEIGECYGRYNVREIDFFDGALFVHKARIMKMCDQIGKKAIDIYWSCRSRVDLVDDELLRAAYASGCRRIFYGIESGSQKILENINKEIDLSQIRDAISLTRKHGIQPLGFFMVGAPGETAHTVRETIDFARSLKLSYAHVCRTIAKPGTDLDRLIINMTGRDFWRDYILNKTPAHRLPSPWTELTQDQLERFTKEFYTRFYFRPVIIWERIMRLRSFAELIRYVKVAVKMLFLGREKR